MTISATELQRGAPVADGRRMEIDGLAVYHLTAKLDRVDVSLCDFDVGEWIWPRLRVAFPIALAACLMPDHPHVVTPLEDPERGRMRLNRLLGQLARRLEVRFLGEAAEPSSIVDRPKLLRHLRYVGLDAPREGLTDDPLSWLFSTHRDVAGATIDPWVDASRLARALHRPVAGFVRRSAEHVVDLDPARLCLGDRRLLVGVPRWGEQPRHARRLVVGR